MDVDCVCGCIIHDEQIRKKHAFFISKPKLTFPKSRILISKFRSPDWQPCSPVIINTAAREFPRTPGLEIYSPHHCCYRTHTPFFSFMPQQTRPEERPHRMSGVRRQYLRSTLFSRTRAHELSRIVNLTLVVFRDSELFQRLHGIWSSGCFTCSLESSSELASVGRNKCSHCVCVCLV